MTISIVDEMRQHITYLDERQHRGDDATISLLRDGIREIERITKMAVDAQRSAPQRQGIPRHDPVAGICESCGADVMTVRAKDELFLVIDARPDKRIALHPASGRAHLIDTFVPHEQTCFDATKGELGGTA